MRSAKARFISGISVIIAAVLLTGCAKNDAISNAEQADKKASPP